MFLLITYALGQPPSSEELAAASGSSSILEEALKDAESRHCYDNLRTPYIDAPDREPRTGVDSTEAMTIIFSIRELSRQGGASFAERCDEAVRQRFPDADVVAPKVEDAKMYASSPHARPPGSPSTGNPVMNALGLFAGVICLILTLGARLVIPGRRNPS